MRQRVDWRTAPPLWRDALNGSLGMDQPAVLRFATDDFMDRFQADLGRPDQRIAGYVARPETWRLPAVGLDDAAPQPTEVMKLYQPIHGRFYLTTAGLVCGRYGLPDKEIRPACGESVFHVLRRLEPIGAGAVDPDRPATFRELGWIDDGAGRWVEIDGGLAVDEQRLPLFPVSYPVPERMRRLLAGLLPVSGRERYETAVVATAIPADTDDVAIQLARPGAELVEPIDIALNALGDLTDLDAFTSGSPDPDSLNSLREATFFALLDLATFLKDHAPGVLTGTPQGDVETTLRDVLIAASFPTLLNWRSALNQTWNNRTVIVDELDLPPSPVTFLTVDAIADAIAALDAAVSAIPETEPFTPAITLTQLLLDVYDPPSEPSNGTGSGSGNGSASGGGSRSDGSTPPTQATATDGAVYVSRFVYERPLCPPSERLTISRPSPSFRLAHFYDPDAPFRDNRIVLPIDTTIEGLRKFPKAVRMDISKQLRRQMDRIDSIKLGDLDDGAIGGGKPIDLGMVCSLSIPIITICALILLMIIVSLLNIVFFWLPLFKICLPKVD